MPDILEISEQPAVGPAGRMGPRQKRGQQPISFVWRGDAYDYHRIADGPALACLDRYCARQQRWPLISGWLITPTGAEVRSIIKQVHDIDVPDRPEGRGDWNEARIAAIESRLEALEARPAFEPTPAPPPPPTDNEKAKLEDVLAQLEAANQALAEERASRVSDVKDDLGGAGEGGAEPEGEPVPDELRDTLARLVSPDADAEAKKAALMKRLIDLEGLQRLGIATPADFKEFEQLTRYASWFK